MFFHENAGNIGLRLDYFAQLYHHADLQADILAVAYRGYSDSSGKPSEKGLKLDGKAVLKYVNENLAKHYENKGGIFVLGRSLGGAVAAASVSDPNISTYHLDGIILENTFTSISDMVDHVFYLVSFFKGLILRMGWYTSELVPNLEMPVLYVTGDQDEIVPFE